MEKLKALVRVQEVQIIENFTVRITFSNQVKKTIDLEPYLHGPIFQDIRNNPNLFQQLAVAGNTITWPNGADIDPDVLYYDLKPAWMEAETLIPA